MGAEILYTDGSRTEEGAGFAVLRGEEIHTQKIQEHVAIFTAELYAILGAVQRAEIFRREHITLTTSSRSSISAKTKYNNGHPIVNKITEAIHAITKTYTFCWVPSHIGIRNNERADKATRNIINQQNIARVNISKSDYKALGKRKVGIDWRDHWRGEINNKLRKIKTDTVTWKTSYQNDREWEVKLCKIRIGHCAFTHEWLLKKYDRPYCQECIVPLTVRHLLLECPEYSQKRRTCLRRRNRDLVDLIEI